MIGNAPVTGTLRVWLAGAIIGVGIVLVFVVFQAARVTELGDVRAMDLAQVARHVAAGEGLTTDFIRPLSLAEVPRISGHPDLAHAPLHILLMGALFRVAGLSTQAVSWSSGLPFLLTIPLVAWLGWRTFSRKVGVLSAVILATNAVALTTVVSGTEGALLGLIFTALCIVLVYHHERPDLRLPLAAAAGALTAALYLTHFAWVVAIVPALMLIALNSGPYQRVRGIIVCLLASAIFVAPWFYRTYRLTGNPLTNLPGYEMLVGTQSYSGNVVYRSFDRNPPGVASHVVSAPREIYRRARAAGMDLFPLLFSIAGLVITPFFLVAAMVPLEHGGMDRLRPGLYVLLALVFAALCLTTPDGRLLVPLAPVSTIVAVAFFYQLLDLRIRPLTERLRARWTIFAVTSLLGLHMLPLFLALTPGRPVTLAAPPAVKRAVAELSDAIPKLSGIEPAPAPVISDMPWAIAWHGKRPAIWLPYRDVDLRRIEQDVGQIRWLVLTPQIVDVARQEQAAGWVELWRRAIYRMPTPGGWQVRQVFANGNWVLFERVSDVAPIGAAPVEPGPR